METSGLKMGGFLNFNQAIALKHDRAACLNTTALTLKHHMVLDGRHIARYVTGDSPNFFKFDLSKIHSCKREDIFLLPEKLFMRRVGDRIIATSDVEQRYALNTLVVVSPKPTCDWSIRFVLGLLNSRLTNFYYVNFLKSTKKVFSEIQARQVEQIPLPCCLLTISSGLAKHDKMVDLVTQMLEAKKLEAVAGNDVKRDFWTRKAQGLDRQIDTLVYELYGLTPEEIDLVEGNAPAGKEPADD